MWMMPLHVHVNQKSDYDVDNIKNQIKQSKNTAAVFDKKKSFSYFPMYVYLFACWVIFHDFVVAC